MSTRTVTKNGIFGLTAWQWAVIAVVLAGAGVGGYWGLGKLLGDDAASASTLLYPVTRGDIAETVSTNGSVTYSTRETLRFSTGGTVADVFVTEGQAVQKGAPVATLDDGTVASLQRAVKEAEISLRTAEENAEAFSEPASALAVAEAEAAVSNAKAALRDAERLKEASLMRAVADAQVALDLAAEKAKKLSAPSAAAISAAQAEVSAAKAALRIAEEALAEIGSGVALAEAGAGVKTAETALANASTDLRVAEQNRTDKVNAAAEALSKSEGDYAGAVNAWTGVRVAGSGLNVPPAELLKSWRTDYDGLLASASTVAATQSDDPKTPWNEQVLFVWVRLTPALIQGACTIPAPQGVRCMQADFESSWSGLVAARSAYDTAVSQQTNAVNGASAALTKAEDALKAVRQVAADIVSGDALALRAAAAGAARSRLADADAAAAKATVVDEAALALANAQSAEAAAKLASAKADLLNIDGEKAEAISLARGQLESAGEKLTAILDIGRDVLKSGLAVTQVKEAKSRLEAARADLAGVTVYAPFAGIVSTLAVEVGQGVNTATAVAEVVDPAQLEVAAVVDEIDVLSLQVGAAASISMDALGTRTLTGSVSEIGAAANNQNGVVSYPISVKIDNPQGLPLREGLSATASVVIRSDIAALLVPVQAVGGSFTRPTVKVVRAGKELSIEVELGISDESFVAVTRGVQEGDQVVVETSTTAAAADARLQRQGAFGQQQGILGGQAGGAGRDIFIAPAPAQQGTGGGLQGGNGRRQQGTGGN